MKQCGEEFKEIRKRGFGISICTDIEISKNYSRSSLVVNDTVSETKIFKEKKKLEGDDTLARSCLEKEKLFCDVI